MKRTASLGSTTIVLGTALAAAPLANAQQAQPVIDVGDTNLRIGETGREIQVNVSGGQQVQGLNLRAAVTDNGQLGGPTLSNANIIDSTIFEGNHTPVVNPETGLTDEPNFEGRRTTTQSGTVSADGLLTTLTVDTTATAAGSYGLKLSGVERSPEPDVPPTDFAGIDADIDDGSLNVFRTAQANLNTNTVDFGTVRVGDDVNHNVTISNVAANDGFSDNLDATITADGDATADSASIDDLAAGANTNVGLGVDTASPGGKSGNVNLDFVSDPTVSDLGQVDLPDQSVAVSANVQAQVNRIADPVFNFIGGDGSLTRNSETDYTLDLGTLEQDADDPLAQLSLLNDVPEDNSDSLAGTFDLGDAADFDLTGFEDVGDLAGGQSDDNLLVALDTATEGQFTGSIVFDPNSVNDSGALDLADITINLRGAIEAADGQPGPGPNPGTPIPTPSAAAAGLFLLATLTLRRRRRQNH